MRRKYTRKYVEDAVAEMLKFYVEELGLNFEVCNYFNLDKKIEEITIIANKVIKEAKISITTANDLERAAIAVAETVWPGKYNYDDEETDIVTDVTMYLKTDKKLEVLDAYIKGVSLAAIDSVEGVKRAYEKEGLDFGDSERKYFSYALYNLKHSEKLDVSKLHVLVKAHSFTKSGKILNIPIFTTKYKEHYVAPFDEDLVKDKDIKSKETIDEVKYERDCLYEFAKSKMPPALLKQDGRTEKEIVMEFIFLNTFIDGVKKEYGCTK